MKNTTNCKEAPNAMPPNLLKILHEVLQHKVPEGKLCVQTLPLVPEMTLALIKDTYPQANLTQEQIEFLMDSPPYWAFCWASGQVLARHILDNPHEVAGKTVVDFGCGSGVVAIAAKIAGAKEVVAVDTDPAALLATRLNADLNNVVLDALTANLPTTAQSNTLLLVADVFYDEANIPMLTDFIRRYQAVIVADSRVQPSRLENVSWVAQYNSCTVPDLGESTDFNSVNVYKNIEKGCFSFNK